MCLVSNDQPHAQVLVFLHTEETVNYLAIASFSGNWVHLPVQVICADRSWACVFLLTEL
jgi:hypothetical protein